MPIRPGRVSIIANEMRSLAALLAALPDDSDDVPKEEEAVRAARGETTAAFTLADCEGGETYTVGGGKCTFVAPKGDWRVFVLRHGKPWLIIEQGHNAVMALLEDFRETLQERDELRTLLREGSEEAARHATETPKTSQSVDTASMPLPLSHLPVIPATCGDCDYFESWNDGSCLLNEEVNAERLEPPPTNCPKRHTIRQEM